MKDTLKLRNRLRAAIKNQKTILPRFYRILYKSNFKQPPTHKSLRGLSTCWQAL